MDILSKNIQNFLSLKNSKNLLFIRHGESMGNHAGSIIGWTDVKLSYKGLKKIIKNKDNLKGREQSHALYPALNKYTDKFNGIYSSDLIRCIDTAFLALGCPTNPVKTDKRLRELHFGNDEGRHFDSLPQAEKDRINSIHYQPEGGENWFQALGRVENFSSELSNGNYLIFGHGGLMCAITWNLGIREVLPNCSAIGIKLNEKNKPEELLFKWIYEEKTEI